MKKYIKSSNSSPIVLSKSALTQQFTDVFNKAMGGDYIEPSDPRPADEYMLRIDIHEEECGSVTAPYNCVVIDIEAETYFDEREIPIDYSEYLSIMNELGETNIQTKSEFYQDMYNRETLEDKMNAVIKAYNPEWYFELWNACRIQAYLDNAVLEA